MPAILQLGDSGAAVTQLQNALKERGFSPGAIDGKFGQGTIAAVMAFQQSENLLADGKAGPRTLAELGLVTDDTLPDATDAFTVQVVSRMFPQTPLGNIKANLPVVLQALVDHKLQDKRMVLTALATIRAETASFRPISEGVSRFNTSPNGHDFDLYDRRADLGNQGPPDGARYCGRGFVQLTGRTNYATYGPQLDPAQDLVRQPELANDPSIAANLLALFIGDRELAIKDALLHGDFQAARRLVNGGTNGLYDFTNAYQTGDQLVPD
ncbi:peptidoglycan-binding protein [Cupriavidus basilensis]|uniref:Peptidoglycan-binding protein n=1 Tax=Cupriavidus basilensis TaxID=68895 RepID=A0ABT6B0S1_9BURK|nr:peptidoglycan-binding protein [Cupriavidus basilensis]MDF3838465.1 peptidoglycan-binding protein [Cupriavidus basilensis]